MMKRIEKYKFGELVRNVRLNCGFTQEHVANQAAISVETIRRIESGSNIPKMKIIENLSAVFNKDLFLAFAISRTENRLSSLYVEMDDLVVSYSELQLLNISKKFDIIEKAVYADNESEINELKQFKMILTGIEISYQNSLQGSVEAYETFLKALRITCPDFERVENRNYSFMEIKCLLLLAVELNALSRYEESNKVSLKLLDIIFAYSNINRLDNMVLQEIKVIQNISYNFHGLSNNEEALTYAEKGIELCYSNKTFYMLHCLYYRKAAALYYLKNVEEAKKWFEKSIYLLDILELDHVKAKYLEITKTRYGIELDKDF